MLFALLLHIKGQTRWSRNLTIVLAIRSTLNKYANSRIFYFYRCYWPALRSFKATYDRHRTFMTLYAADTHRLPFHIAGADSEFSLAQACDRSYRVRPGDICDSIAIRNRAPTLISLYITIAHFTNPLKYSYQIMCENEQIDGKCSNLGIGEVKIVLKLLLRTF